MDTGFVIIYVTFPSEEQTKSLCSQIVENKLAACSNIFPIQSSYWWNEELCEDNEWVGILKTIPEHISECQKLIESLHPYDLPCIIQIPVRANSAYEKWIRDSVKST